MTEKENILRCYRFQGPESIPCKVSVDYQMQKKDPEGVYEVLRKHPRIFPHIQQTVPQAPDRERLAPFRKAGVRYTDSWGCDWETSMDGITGGVVKHALESWDDFDGYTPPDPEHQDGWQALDWEERRRGAEEAREKGRLVSYGLRHGHTFLTLTYIRGYQNLIFDMADEREELRRLIDMVTAFNKGLIDRCLALRPDMVTYPEDLGMQKGAMISPDMFRRYIVPAYRTLMEPAKAAGALIHMHSDGDIMDLLDDILSCGVDVLNPQDLVNGIDNLADRLKGRAAIHLDIDRQEITVRGTPRDIEEHIREAVEKLSSPGGGLSLRYGCYDPTPLENLDAVMTAMEKYMDYKV